MPNNFDFVVSDIQIESKARIGKTLKLFQTLEKTLLISDLNSTFNYLIWTLMQK